MRTKLYQEIIGTVSDEIKVTIALDKTLHAGQRQNRDENDFISNNDIGSTIKDAVKIIAKNMLLDTIGVGNYICIINHKFKPALNIIGNIKRDGNNLELVIVTIMKKDGFYPKAGTYRLQIK